MNKRIRELVKQAGGHFSTHNLMSNPIQHRESIELWDDKIEKFAELIVRECITECLQEWYELNAESVADDDPFRDPRATGIRVGQKNGILKCISKIKLHFGVEE